MIRLDDVGKSYYDGFLKPKELFSVNHINLQITSGKTTALIGKSGCGKTTIANIIAGIIPQSSGRLYYKNQEITYPFPKAIRQNIQMIFQHPEHSFHPKWTLYDSLAEPYRFLGIKPTRDMILASVKSFGLYEEHLSRRPSGLSGGELQRASIARTMTLNPELIILDEPTSMLDTVSQAQVMWLLKKLQKETGVAYLFITHHVPLAELFADTMYGIQDGILQKIGGD